MLWMPSLGSSRDGGQAAWWEGSSSVSLSSLQHVGHLEPPVFGEQFSRGRSLWRQAHGCQTVWTLLAAPLASR